MKRLLCIVGSMNAGGAETFLMKMYRCLDKTKYQMDFIVATSEMAFYDDEILMMGGKIYHISPKSAGLFRNFIEIIKIVRGSRYESVMRVSQHSLSALELLAARMGGAKILVFRSSNSNTTTGKGKDLFLHKVCKFMPLLFANVKIAPSTEAAEFMFGKNCVNKGRAYLLHNAIDLDVYKYSEEARKKIRNEFNIDNRFVVGHVGRFNQQKNHIFLLDVFSKFQNVYSDSVLMLVGSGELEEKIKERVSQLGLIRKVVFTSVRSDVPSLLSAMDVFVFPSLYEGMPNTVIEAQATGLPCIVADTITREVDITGLVRYLSLSQSAELWATEIETNMQKDRADMKTVFESAQYDINGVVQQFIQFTFGQLDHV